MAYEMLTAEQRDLIELLHQVQVKELQPLVKEYDRLGKFPMQVHDKLGELGFHGMSIPAEYGGLGLSVETNVLLREELGRIDGGFGLSYALSKGAGAVVFNRGTEEQKHLVAEYMLSGGTIASCITEPNAGSDVLNIRTTAVRDGDDWIINGTKNFITNGTIAGMFMVVAYTDRSKGAKGMSLFLVEKERGVKIGGKEDKMGLRLSETCDVIFEDIRVPAKNMIGAEGEGYSAILSTLGRARVVNMSTVVGIAQAALDYAIEYSKQRETFGVPICEHQGIQFMLADMEMQVQAARQYLLYGARMLDAGKNVAIVSSGAKAFATEAAMKVTIDAVQIFGGYGYSREYPVEKLMRDVKVFSIFEGTNQIQRMVMGRGLTK